MNLENNYKDEVSSFIALHDVKDKKTDKNDNIADIDSEPDFSEHNFFLKKAFGAKWHQNNGVWHK